jgi:glycosidase
VHCLRIRLARLTEMAPCVSVSSSEFHVRRDARDRYGWSGSFFSIRGDVVFANPTQSRIFANLVNAKRGATNESALRASDVNAMGLIHEILHAVIALYKLRQPQVFAELKANLLTDLDAGFPSTLRAFVQTFPTTDVYANEVTVDDYLSRITDGVPNDDHTLEETLLLWVSNENPSYAPIEELISDRDLRANTAYSKVLAHAQKFFDAAPKAGPQNQSLVDMLLAPSRHSPKSLMGQLEYMRENWGLELSGSNAWRRLLFGVDFIREEGKWFSQAGRGFFKDGNSDAATFKGDLYEFEPEQFSADHEWMPRVVMIAKSTFVWLAQLTKEYGRPITTLAEIPDEELDRLARSGFTGLWLIGLWKRSRASARIKQIQGNHDAVASAYSLFDYEIADDIGGYLAYCNLKERAERRGLRLASDMVPNHMGIDSSWAINHPDRFIQADEPPFAYSFNGPDLSDDPRVGIFIEDGYYSHSDASVVFKRVDRYTGSTKYIYHGNDGTSMPWNDTAQLNYLRAEVREAVIQTILHVARLFPIIRFDAAMTLAKRHYQRLWFPQPGTGGDIPSRAQYALTKEQFDEAMPIEFWREVVDRVAKEVPNTLLLAEAFWMMEGYFVRSLGMHRVYNSAFMNMLKREENDKFRVTIKNVLEFNSQILKRYVNFMNNPDEETAVAQFGKDDKYFGVCILMSTMPGLPMFGHGQIEGFTEKYGMEYKRPRYDESPDGWLVSRHEREIFPLLKRRYLFSDVEHFYLYDFFTDNGGVDEDVFVYSNRAYNERAVVLYHNKFKDTRGWARESVGFLDGGGGISRKAIGEGLGLSRDGDVFAIYKNHVTGLEHLRPVSEIWERGIYAELGAFKYQVLIDWRERQDTMATPFRELEREIGRGGVSSMDEALVDFTFRAIHASYVEAISPSSAAYLLSAKSSDASNAIAEKLAHIFDGMRFAMEKRFGRSITEPSIDEAIAFRVEARIGGIARVLKRIRDSVSPLSKPPPSSRAPAKSKESEPPPSRRKSVPPPSKVPPATDALEEAVRAFAGIDAGALLVAITFSLAVDELYAKVDGASASAIDAWRLDRPIARAMRNAGASVEQTKRAVELVRFIVAHRDVVFGARSIDGVLALEAARDFLRVHSYDGIEWFEQEAIDVLAYVVAMLAAIDEASTQDARKRVVTFDKARARAESIAQIARDAKFHYAEFSEALTAPPPSKRKSARPPANSRISRPPLAKP